MEFIDFWLWSCKSYFKFITCQSHSGSPSWAAARYRSESSPVGFPVPPAVTPLCVPCSGAAHPDAQRGLRAIWEQTLAPSPPAATGTAVPDTSVCQHWPCCASLHQGKGAMRNCAQQISGSVLVAQLDRWQAPLVPAHLQPCSPHTQIMIPSSPLQRKAGKPEPDARFHLSLQTAWKQ